MVKERRILSYFICWLVLGFIVCFFGITKTYAAEQKTGLGFLNNSSVHISNNKGADIELTRQTANNVNMDIKSIVFISNYNFQANTVYDYEIQITGQYLRNIDKATILSNNGICTLIGLSGLGEEYTKVRFTCSNATSSITIGLSNSNDNNITNGYNINWQSIYLWSITDTIDLGPIINNQTQNTQDILNNDNQNTQDIIDSNKETQNVIKDQFNSCRPSKNLFNAQSWVNSGNNSNYYTYLNNGFIITSVDDRGLSSFTESDKIILSNGTYTFSNYGSSGLRIYNDGTDYPLVNQPTFEVKLGYIYVKFVSSERLTIQPMLVKGNTPSEFEPYGEEICINKLDEQNDKLNDLNNSLNNPNIDGSLGSAGNFFDNFNTSDHGGLSGIITAPLVAINQMLNTSCSPMTTTFKGKELSLPCGYEFWNKMGPIQDFVNLVLGGLLCYQIIIKLYKLIEKIKNPEDDRLEVMDL